jgi:hypothetical protein
MILFLDTNIVIYAVEGTPVFGPKAVLRLAVAQSAGDSFVISDLTRMECLVGPLKTNDTGMQASFHSFFARSDVQVVAITAAVEHGANVFLTADARLGSFTDLVVEVLR